MVYNLLVAVSAWLSSRRFALSQGLRLRRFRIACLPASSRMVVVHLRYRLFERYGFRLALHGLQSLVRDTDFGITGFRA